MSDGVELVKEQSMDSVAFDPAIAQEGLRCRLGDLRGAKWRMDLGILPSSPSASINDLRRVTADSRRRYASLRRQLLVDAHVANNGSTSPDSVIDNPLSQNPDSMWGRFFRNAELERMVDQDLSRLYPELDNYFQTLECQGIMRRVLLLWCLNNPEFGYRQGMHELLAPLLYVLHVDVEYLAEVRELYEDYFTDKFDGFSFYENHLTYKFDFKKFSENMGYRKGAENITGKTSSLRDLDPNKQVVVLINDSYGAEGELGVLLSAKFIEHDAYCMFDALMNGAGGAVAMAEFFSSPPKSSSHSGFAPVIEASASLYHLLSIVDSSVHTHLVELGVEPQYFSLRWLRVLFGREFALENLLSLWDEIFSWENKKLGRSPNNDTVICCSVLDSSRGAFISAFAVSMILHLRSSLLATENATLCLKRLLNFPEDVNLGKLVKKAKSLQALAMEANNKTPLMIHAGFYDGSRSLVVRSNDLLLESSSLRTLSLVPDNYWEEQWSELQKEKEHERGAIEQVPNRKKGWSQTLRMRLSRTTSGPSTSKVAERKTAPKSSVRRSLLKDLARQLGEDEGSDDIGGSEDLGPYNTVEYDAPDNEDNSVSHTPERSYSSCSTGGNISEENSSTSSDPHSLDHEQGSGSNSVASSSSVDDSDASITKTVPCESNQEGISIADNPSDISSLKTHHEEDSDKKPLPFLKERKFLSGKFQWLWKFGRHHQEEGTSGKGVTEAVEACNVVDNQIKACNVVDNQSNVLASATSEGCNIVSGTSKGENLLTSATSEGCNIVSGSSKGKTVDRNSMISLKTLGQSLLENIQVIESVFHQEKSQSGPLESLSKNGLVEKGQVTATDALKELRKISNLLSEM